MSQNNPWGQQPPQDQWGQQQPQQDQWGQQQPWGQQPPPQPWGQQPPYYGPPRKSGCLKWGIIVGVISLLLCVGGGAALFFFGKGVVEDAQKPVDAFMQAGKANNLAAAKALISSSSTATDEEIEALLGNRQLFEDYKALSLNGFDANTSTGRNATVIVKGTVEYTSGPKGNYEALVVLEGDEWKLDRIQIER